MNPYFYSDTISNFITASTNEIFGPITNGGPGMNFGILIIKKIIATFPVSLPTEKHQRETHSQKKLEQSKTSSYKFKVLINQKRFVNKA